MKSFYQKLFLELARFGNAQEEACQLKDPWQYFETHQESPPSLVTKLAKAGCIKTCKSWIYLKQTVPLS